MLSVRGRQARWLFLVFLVAGVSAIVALWYAARERPDAGNQAFGGTYVEGVAGGPARINPLFAHQNDVDAALSALIFSGLTRLDEQGRPYPDLAETWDISADGRAYTFRLRRGVLWHDGAELTSEDVVFTYSLLKSPGLRSPPPAAKLLAEVTVRKVDALTIVFELQQPYAGLPAYLSIGILPQHLLTGIPPGGLGDAAFNDRPIGTGPFRLDQLTAERAVLGANPAYHFGQAYVQRIEMRFFRDEGAVLAALRARQIDGALFSSGLGAADRFSLERQSGLRVQALPSGDITLVYLNLREPMFQDRRVRQALLYALDREVLVSETLGGGDAHIDSPVCSASWAYAPSLSRYGHDAKLAGVLLDEAGWRVGPASVRSNGAAELAITLTTNNDPLRVAVAEEIAKRWTSVGVKVTVEPLGATALVRDLLEPRKFQASLFAYRPGPDPDPYPFWHSTQAGPTGRNMASLADARFDRLLEEGRLVSAQVRRTDLYREFQELFAQEVPAIPLYESMALYVQRTTVRGVRIGMLSDPGARFWQVQDWYVKTR